MEKTYDHTKESEIYSQWESIDAFKPKGKGIPYTILMPPPNANASLHAGHAMYTIDDVLTRFRRMQGYDALWIPGMDHAGFETQFVYEKHLSKEGKSRMDFDRKTLYENIFSFVEENSGQIYSQFKRLGFSADWSRSVFTLDENVVKKTHSTFKKLFDDGYLYRDSYLVNYCVHCGTSLAELEVVHVERVDPLYYIKYPLIDNPNEFVVVATVRPEPIFVDTHLAVNPKDKKNNHLIGKKVSNPLTNKEMDIIGEDYVDPKFGTGVVKLTPAHDPNDFEIARKRKLPILQAIDWNGKITSDGGKYAGMRTKAAREAVIQDLGEMNLIEKIDDKYMHSVITCYRCGRDLEPLTIPNWFIKVDNLKSPVREVVSNDEIIFHPKRFKKQMLSWLDIMHDWPISRQIVWGIRIPVWYKVEPKAANIFVWWLNSEKKLMQGPVSQFLQSGVSLETIMDGLQKVQTLTGANQPEYVISDSKPKEGMYLPETDTFDTWFSSSQWPLVTIDKDDMSSRYPTDVLGTYSDILKFWVSRMILFGKYLENKIPFKHVYLWSVVADSKGVKMSKSKGNVVNPLELIEKYGADALRMSLLYGTPAGSKIILSEQKVKGMRNFSNKIWNATRFLQMIEPEKTDQSADFNQEFSNKLDEIVKITTNYLEQLKLDKALENLYENFWHWYCDWAIEQCKSGAISKENMLIGLDKFLKMLHPFAPFVTESCYQNLNSSKNEDNLLINAPWPTK